MIIRVMFCFVVICFARNCLRTGKLLISMIFTSQNRVFLVVKLEAQNAFLSVLLVTVVLDGKYSKENPSRTSRTKNIQPHFMRPIPDINLAEERQIGTFSLYESHM